MVAEMSVRLVEASFAAKVESIGQQYMHSIRSGIRCITRDGLVSKVSECTYPRIHGLMYVLHVVDAILKS